MADPTNRRRWLLVVLMSTVGLGIAGCASLFHLGWKYAVISTVLEVAMICGFLGWTRDPLMGRLLVFGVIAGFGELPADAFSVQIKQTLVYPLGEPMIWASPLYMPFSWIAVMAQMGFISWWLARRMGTGKAMVIMAVIGAGYVPLFEYLARSAGFWYYQNCPMLMGATPYYVIAAEAIICAALPPLLRRIDERSWSRGLGLGIAESFVIYAASRLAFAVLG
jgi:hypothetical protein